MRCTSSRPAAAWTLLLILSLAVTVTWQAAADSQPQASALNKRVIIVIGSTGSKAVYAVLQAAGVWMHPDTDAALNSRLYQQRVLVPFSVGLPANHSCVYNLSAVDWSIRHRPADLFHRIAPANLAPNVTDWHKEMALEMLQSVPSSATVWGWKHPYALYTMNTLYQTFPNVHIIHQVQDGRDYALNNLMRRSRRTTNIFEQHFVQLLAGRNFTAEQLGTLDYSAAVAQGWAVANQRALAWAGERATALRGTHSVVRLEDLCHPDRAAAAVRAMLHNSGLPHNDTVVSTALARLKPWRCASPQQQPASACGCGGGMWRTAYNSSRPRVAAAMRRIDANISAALEAFDYLPEAPLGMPAWLDAKPIMAELTAAARTAAGPSNHPVILTFVSNGYERVVSNWLAWLQHSRVDTSHVLIVTRGESHAAVQAVAAGTGVVVFNLPVLSPTGASSLDEKGRKADEFRNVRGGVWLERVRTMYELTQQGMSVLMSDLDAIWVRNPLPYIMGAAGDQPQGYDMLVSKGYFPSEVHKSFRVAGCMGFVFLNATQPTWLFIRALLRERLRQLSLSSVRYYNDQRHMNQALVQADMAYNVTMRDKHLALQPSTVITSHKLTTAPVSMRVLYMPESMVQRTCDNSTTNPDALVMHCQSAKSGEEKETYLKQLNLWRQLPGAAAEPNSVVR